MSVKTVTNLTETNGYFAHVMSLTQEFSEPIHNTLQNILDYYLSYFNNGFFSRVVIAPMCLTVVFFWLIGALYALLDIYKWPQFLYKYKTQDSNVTLEEVLETAKVALYNQMTVQLATSIGVYLLTKILPMDTNYRVPPLGTIIYHILVFILLQEISFYYIHRLLHYGKLYRYIHKVHHRWQAPIAISALYCHPFEHFLGNLVPVMLGPVVMGSHIGIIYLWLLIVHIVTLNDHSGYHFPLLPSPEFHDYHHMMFTQNFGRMGFLDYLHGTSDRYLKSKYSKRDQVLLSLTPIKVLIPE